MFRRETQGARCRRAGDGFPTFGQRDTDALLEQSSFGPLGISVLRWSVLTPRGSAGRNREIHKADHINDL